MHFSGDLYFRLKHKGSFKNKLICRFALNTSFIIENISTFTKKTVDPDSIEKDERFSDKFKIEIHFKDLCSVCKPSEHHDKLCERCKYEMSDEIPNW